MTHFVHVLLSPAASAAGIAATLLPPIDASLHVVLKPGPTTIIQTSQLNLVGVNYRPRPQVNESEQQVSRTR